MDDFIIIDDGDEIEIDIEDEIEVLPPPKQFHSIPKKETAHKTLYRIGDFVMGKMGIVGEVISITITSDRVVYAVKTNSSIQNFHQELIEGCYYVTTPRGMTFRMVGPIQKAKNG